MKVLIISPQAGFGNRLRALCSAKILGEITGREVFHYWIEDEISSKLDHVNEMKSIDPTYLFDLKIPKWNGGSPDIAFSEWIPGNYWYHEQSTAIRKLNPKRVEILDNIKKVIECEDDVILIETSIELKIDRLETVYDNLMSDTYTKFFSLNKKWEEVYENIPVFDWGISIRKGDFVQLYPEADTSEIQAINRINSLHGSKFITSDDINFINSVRTVTFNWICTIPNLKPIEQTVYQFLTISKCKSVMGTRGSSFSRQAALFGNKKYVEL